MDVGIIKYRSYEKDQIIKELVKALDLEELTDGYRRRLLIIDSQIEALNRLKNDYTEKLNDLCNVIIQLQAVCKVCGQLNILAGNLEPTTEQVPQKGKGNQGNGEITLRFVKGRQRHR